MVLEKPSKFNPPSHGRRLPKNNNPPRHYGGDVSEVEAAAQRVRDYPGMMAPAGTWSHWFLNSRAIHLCLTLVRRTRAVDRAKRRPGANSRVQGMLTSLAVFTFVENFKRTSPFVDLVPSGSDFLSHPLQSVKLLVEVFRLSTAHRSREVAEERTRGVDDVEKRRMFRKAHGMQTHTGIAAWLGWNDQGEPETPAVDGEADSSNLAEDMRKRKKFLGIF